MQLACVVELQSHDRSLRRMAIAGERALLARRLAYEPRI
jgi:hypothetical protein